MDAEARETSALEDVGASFQAMVTGGAEGVGMGTCEGVEVMEDCWAKVRGERARRRVVRVRVGACILDFLLVVDWLVGFGGYGE